MTSPTNLPSESDEQIGFVNWFRSRFPGVLIFHIPNGGHRSISVAKKLRAEGVVPGIPDLQVPEWRLWIEMKRAKGGRLSGDQEKVIAHLRGIGDTVFVASGAREASAMVLGWVTSSALSIPPASRP